MGPGRRVRQILRQQGRSATWLARQLGLNTPTALANYLSGWRRPPADLWERCAAILGVPLDLITADDQPHDTKRSA